MNLPPMPWFDDAYERQLLQDAADRLRFDRADDEDSRMAAAALGKAAVADPWRAGVFELQAPWVQHAIPLRVIVTKGRALEADYPDPPADVVRHLRVILQDPERLAWLVKTAEEWLHIYRRGHRAWEL